MGECSAREEVTSVRLAKVSIVNSASGQAGGRPRSSRFLYFHQTTLPSNKTNPMSWFRTFENGKKCDRSTSQIPLAFWLLANPHKAHISLSSHLSASEFVWLSCEWWKLKSYVDNVQHVENHSQVLSALERPEVHVHILMQPKQTYSSTCAYTQHH